MNKEISIQQFVRAIQKLPSDKPRMYPGKWYQTQREHWLCWLCEYDGPGAYNRMVDTGRDAKYVYNRIVEYRMLLWLIRAAGVRPKLVRAARAASHQASSLQAKSAAIRKIVPWEILERALWKAGK